MNLNELVVYKTQEVKQFAKIAAAAKTNFEQEKIDGNFSEVIKKIENQVEQVVFVFEKSSFRCSDNTLGKLVTLIKLCKEEVRQDKVTVQKIREIRASYFIFMEEISKEWASYYEKTTQSLNEILRLSKSIVGANVNVIITRIVAGKEWDIDQAIRKRMFESIDEAIDLINKLDLNDNIVLFLRKLMNHSASIADIDDTIIEWIKKEKIENRIKLSF